MNFGASGSFGPTQYYLVYKHLARNFEHDAVIVAILPDNDFLDDDYEYGLKMHEGRYRPFFVGTDPDYELIYTPPADDVSTVRRVAEQVLRQFTYTGNLIKYLRSMARHQDANISPNYSGYFDYTPEQLARLKKVLSELRREAGGKPILVLTIPCDTDILRSAETGEPPLPSKLQEICDDLDMQYVDLLPAIRAETNGWQQCYLRTDRHWNAYGNAVAADVVVGSADFYRKWKVSPQVTQAGSR